MARLNYVNSMAYVSRLPVFQNTVDGQVGMIALTTIIKRSECSKGEADETVFGLRTQEPEVLEKIKALKINDVVSVTGFLATKEKDKSAKCDECGTVNRRVDACVSQNKVKSGGNIVYVYPINLSLKKHCEDTAEAIEYLRNNQENINRVLIMGNLTSAPVTGKLGKIPYTRFQIAVNRKYHPKAGGALYDRTDYPWIYSYGENALRDKEKLDTGSLVFVEGELQSRNFKEQYTCQECGHTYEVPGRTLEVAAQNIQYIRLPDDNNEDVAFNYFSSIAFVKKLPVIREVNGIREGLVGLTTIMSKRDFEKAKSGYQLNSVSFCVRTNEPAILNAIEKLELFDIVSVHGFISTKNKEKKATCIECGTENDRMEACVMHGNEYIKSGGNIIYITPDNIIVNCHCSSEQEAFEYLHKNQENVNKVFIVGDIISMPVSGALQNGKKLYTRFQIAAKNSKNGSSYPWVYSYGDKSIDDYQNLDKDSLVMIDGALQSRKFKEQYVCKECGTVYDVPGRTLEVLSYDTEYLRLPSYS